MTIDGALQVPSYAGFQIGTSTNRIPASAQAKITFVAPNVGTDISGIRGIFGNTTNRPLGKMSHVFYGEIPTYRKATLTSNAAAGQNKIVLTENLS